MRPVMVGADQCQVPQFGGAAAFPVHQVVRVQGSGGPAAGHHAGAVAVFQRPAQPPIDGAGRSAGADHLSVPVKPHLARCITGQIAGIGIAEYGS